MQKTERILFGIFCLILVLNMANVPATSFLFIMFSSAYSMFYFAAGFLVFNQISFSDLKTNSALKNTSAKKAMASIAFGLAICILILGIVFKVMIWPGAEQMLLNGAAIAAFVTILAFLFAKNRSNKLLKAALPRMAIALIFAGVAYAIPTNVVIETKHRNNVELQNLLKDAAKNPTDTAARNALNRYYKKDKN